MDDKIKDYVPMSSPNKDTPIFMGHGGADPLVKHAWGEQTAAILTKMGFKVDFRTYPGLQHSADPKEIDDLEAYLQGQLKQI